MSKPKTILVSLSSNIVVGNFAMPDGVFERLGRLSRDNNIRIVFFVDPAFHDKILPLVGKADVVFEQIEKYVPRTLIQKAFYFFYSYLIFTGTTRLLATFGARADTPPAGGNRYLSILKASIAKIFGWSKFIKRFLVPQIYKFVFSDRPHRALFDKHKPDIIFVPNIAFFPDIELVAEAKRRNIKSIGMAQNWDHLNKYFIPQHSDILLVQNEAMTNEAVELHAYNKSQIRVVGFPQFDLYAQADQYVLDRTEFEKEFRIESGKKIILYISGSVYAPDESEILSVVSEWINDKSLDKQSHLLIRPYVSKRDTEQEKAKYGELIEKQGVSFNWQHLERSKQLIGKYVSMFYYADVVMSVFSTTAIEAAIFDKPTIVVGFDGYQRRPFHQSVSRLEQLAHFRHILETDGISVARSFGELNVEINKALNNPDEGRKERKKLVNKMCYRVDGKAGERIVDGILQEL